MNTRDNVRRCRTKCKSGTRVVAIESSAAPVVIATLIRLAGETVIDAHVERVGGIGSNQTQS
jgi:hypothetical protein